MTTRQAITEIRLYGDEKELPDNLDELYAAVFHRSLPEEYRAQTAWSELCAAAANRTAKTKSGKDNQMNSHQGRQDLFLTYDPYAQESPAVAVFCLQCRRCGFEMEDVAQTPHGVCPKCHGNTWERFVRPGSLLRVADGQLQPDEDVDVRDRALARAG